MCHRTVTLLKANENKQDLDGRTIVHRSEQDDLSVSLSGASLLMLAVWCPMMVEALCWLDRSIASHAVYD